MIAPLRLLFSILNKTQKRRFFLLLNFMVLSSFFEIASIIALIDFANFLSSESQSNYYGFFEIIFNALNINIINLDVFLRGILIIFILILTVFTSFLSIHSSAKFSYLTGGEIETKLFNFYLKRDYLYHLDLTSAKLLNNIYELVRRTTEHVLSPCIVILSKLIFLIPLISGLLIYKTEVTLIAILLCLGLYFIFYLTFKNKLLKLGQSQNILTKNKFSILQEGFNAIKEIKIFNKYKFFKSKYTDIYSSLANLSVQKDLISKFPRSLIEFFIFSAVVLFIAYLKIKLNYNFTQIVFNLSFFIICAYKIIPAFQQIYLHLNYFRYHVAALKELSGDLKEMQKFYLKENVSIEKDKRFSSFKNINVKNIAFNYKNSSDTTLKNLSFQIKRGEKIGITGPSGSGKTTLIHILLGLIKQYSGEIKIDDEILGENNLTQWQKLLGFVPQSVFLSSKSIKENIAFGEEKDQIDKNKIKKLIDFSQLTEIVSALPEKENSKIGERGIKLSGGQQQRLGIARAFYPDPKIVFFDEATNSLDVLTENEIMNSLNNLDKDITVIMIAHRLDVIKKFDKIIYLNKGKIDGFGTFDELLKNNLNFKKLVEAKNS